MSRRGHHVFVPGMYFNSAGVCSGQPSVLCVHRAWEPRGRARLGPAPADEADPHRVWPADPPARTPAEGRSLIARSRPHIPTAGEGARFESFRFRGRVYSDGIRCVPPPKGCRLHAPVAFFPKPSEMRTGRSVLGE